MKEGFEPKLFKNYNVTPEEQLKLDKFLKKNLKKGLLDHLSYLWLHPFFCFKERWKTSTLSGLPVFERLDHQKLLSTTLDLGNNGQTERCKILYQTGCIVGDTTIYESEKETNGKLLSRPIKDFLNQW
jgi:hypothetical protein